MKDLTAEINVWQVSAGSTNTSYAAKFIDYGVALIGPGDAGPWRPERYRQGFLQQFVNEIKIGDVLLLRTGSSDIQAVGLVASEYQYLSQFDDVNGLDLQHARRVRWFKLPEPEPFKKYDFGAQPSRFSQVHSKRIVDYANKFINSPPSHWQKSSLPSLPVEEASLEAPPIELEEIIAQVNDLVHLYEDPDSFGDFPTEGEMVAHWVVPFLRALGWAVEKIAIEWQKVDVLVFTRLPRSAKNCYFMVEAKRFGEGVEGALEQVVGYSKEIGANCDVIVTDGIRYRMYDSDNGYTSVAYANLNKLKKSSLELFNRMANPNRRIKF